MQTFTKDPNAILDYSWDWSAWLTTPETIASYAFDLDGLTQIAATQAAGVVTIVVSGGTVGKTHSLRCRITTNATAPRTDDRTILLKIRDR